MVCSILITLFYTPVMIRLMGNSEYGLYNTVSSLISIIALLNLGFGSSYIRYYSDLKSKNDSYGIYRLNGMFLLIFSFISIIVIVCGSFLINNLKLVFSAGLTSEEYEIAKKLFTVLIINLAISIPMNIFTCIITARESFVFFKLVSLLKTIASPLLALPLLLLGFRSFGMVISILIISVACDILYLVYVFLFLKERFIFNNFDVCLFKDIFSYTILIAIHLVVDQINWNVDKVLLGRFKGTSDVAVYSVGYSLYAHYMTLGLAFVNLFFPRVHSVVSSGFERIKLREKLTDIFSKVGKIQFVILAPVALGFVFWGKAFINFWVGKEYSISYYVALLLIIPGSIDIIQNIGIEIQRAQKLHKFRAIVYIIMAVVNVVVSIILCPRFGVIGCAFGTAVSLILVQGIVINFYYHKKCNLDVIAFWKSITGSCKTLLLPIVFGLICKFIRPEISLIELIVQLCIFSCIYVVSLYFFGLDYNDKTKIKNILLKRKNI